jgi:hypothetical protein
LGINVLLRIREEERIRIMSSFLPEQIIPPNKNRKIEGRTSLISNKYILYLINGDLYYLECPLLIITCN